jgi:hypothetical protein
MGWVKGKPVRYVAGHTARTLPGYYTRDDSTGCWIWQGRINSRGYGATSDGTLAHRAIYEKVAGPIPEGHVLHHRCDNRACVNPAHLVPLMPEEHSSRLAADERVAELEAELERLKKELESGSHSVARAPDLE